MIKGFLNRHFKYFYVMAALGPISIFLMALDLLVLFFGCSRVFFSCEQHCHIAFPIQFFLLKKKNIAFSVAGGV